MNRITACFDRCLGLGRKVLIPFVTAGDPNREVTVPLMHEMVNAGADLIELGVPFSDPMADGPTIQRSSERALEKNTSIHHVLEMVAIFRQQDAITPVVLMGYLNPIENMGAEHFVAAAVKAGVDGVLTVDLPPEEGEEFEQFCEQHDLAPIYLLAPTSTEARIGKIARSARGFIYYVSVKGVTGSQVPDVAEVAAKIETIRQQSKLPIGVGFGIRDAASAAAIGGCADAVVVGSVLVSRMEALQQTPEQIPAAIGGILAEMRKALDEL
ncbi:MAG: tryptophan synthase subunit alpha [Gammaproteobacteria bacterium]|jgi:tryptophan synthase alpha chain|nr:tryptophan synthase subunit alpha [Gammaproteobacteria bacterium]